MSETQKTDTAKREEEVLAFWNAENVFQKSVEKPAGRSSDAGGDAPQGEYVFYDGPPFATGTPHYGHLVQSAIKDTVPRYWTMKGYRVERQWGWDCHGLPIENIVEKELGTKHKKDIEELGVKKFNDLCREKIFTYADVWDQFIPRFGRWADMENPYRTMDKDYMESEWWAFKQLYDKGLIYEDYRSMHICPRCETTLAQSEVTEGYQTIKDLAVTVEFPIKDEDNTSILAWTTTPWTLPGNVALAVGPEIDYVTVEKKDEGKGDLVRFILARDALERVFPEDEYEIVAEMKGSDLVGKEYTPPFDSFVNDETLEHRENAWKVYAADFVTADEGTGIAHEAPAFGADDMELAQQENLPMIQHVGMDGIIVPEVKELAGLSVKPIDDHQSTDVEVIKYLAGKSVLFAKEKYEHSYPHCWRCDTPLINYATTSWFVAVEKIKDDLLEHATNINWSPKHVKEGRWGEWLKGARDWSISRQRFWANTMPVWRCRECKKERVFGSAQELTDASGQEVEDLHKDVVDEIVVPCECGKEMRRIPDVLDTWFDSGSVPYAVYHYPFENENKVDERVPANFIAEAQDQVSKWFYYQHVLSGALFQKNAFSNVITSGIVLAEDGKKMSKRLQNYPDPQHMLDTYGADAVRLYMTVSPVVRGENLNFSEQGVAEIARKVIGRLVNVYEFFALVTDGKVKAPHETPASEHVLDQWIIARVQQLHKEVTDAMDNYELDRATRPLGDFVDDLSTWYLRRSRDRLKSGPETTPPASLQGPDASSAVAESTSASAFSPRLASDAVSEPLDSNADTEMAQQTLAWVLKETAKVMAPFAPFHADWLWQRVREDDGAQSVHLAQWSDVQDVDEEVLTKMEEVRDVVTAALEKRAEANIKVRQPLSVLTISVQISNEYAELIKDEVNVKDVAIDTSISEIVALNTDITPELKEEGEVRELVRAIQAARKEAGLKPGEKTTGMVNGSAEVQVLIEKHNERIAAQTDVQLSFGESAEETAIVLN